MVAGPGADITLAASRTAWPPGWPQFKWPERLEIVPGLPVTKVGKLDKKALRELLTTPALHRP